MNRTSLKNSIRERYGEDAQITHYEAKAWLIDEKTGQSWKEHLTRTFEVRLEGAIERGIDSEVIDETRGFLKHLEVFTPDRQLSLFSAKTRSKNLGGWAIDDEIVFCVASSNDD